MITATHPLPQELMAYADGEVSGALKESLAQHVAECEECRRTVAQFQNDTKVLRAWSVEPIPVRVEGTIRPETARHSGSALRWRFPAWSKWGLGIGLSAAALFLLAERPRTVMEKSISPVTHAIRPVTESQEAASDVGSIPAPRAVLSLSRSAASSSAPILGDRAQNSFGALTSDRESFVAPMIARTVSLMLIVKDFAAARANVDAILARHHGYAADLTANTAEGAPRTLQASLRVPAPELTPTLSELKLLGRVEKESQSGEEVTQRHADLLARLKNARETEQRLQTILQQHTGKISDVLAVEQEIARVRGEIEEMEAEQKSLEHRVEFATVNLQFADEYKAQLVIPPLSADTRLHNAAVEGYRNVGETLLGILVFFAQYGPALLIWALLLGIPAFFVWRRYRRSLAAI